MKTIKELGTQTVKKALENMFAEDFIKWPPDCVGILYECKRPEYVEVEKTES